MKVIPLNALPNQKVAFNVDGAYWQIHVYQALTSMCVDVSRNGVALINGLSTDSGIPLLPYSYMTYPDFGNFIFDGEVDYENFGSTCNLLYLGATEYETYRAALFLGVEA